MSKSLLINEIIPKKYKCMVYKDESNSTFLLTKCGEAYRLSKNRLRLYIWSFKLLSQLHQKGAILDEIKTDESFYTIDILNANLGDFIALGRFRKRPHKRGKFIKNAEKRLGHKIYAYNPADFLEDKQ